MKFATDKSHRDYFYKQGSIEFDKLLTSEQVGEVNRIIDRILCQRLRISPDQLGRQNPNELFLQGHDLFRQDESLKKILLHRRYAEIAVELLEARALRIGYDQLFVAQPKKPLMETVYDEFIHQDWTLQDRSCIKPVICGLMLCLESPKPADKEAQLFSKTEGNGIYFKADISLDFSFLAEEERGRYLLIVYADQRTVYILNEKDPHTHYLKHQGYVFGDRFSEKLNPTIYR